MTLSSTSLRTALGPVTLRPFDPRSDYPRAAALISTCHAHDDIDWLPTPETLAHEWGPASGFDPALDAAIAEGGGEAVGLVGVDWRERVGKINHNVEIWVRPSDRRAGIGTALLLWAEERSRAATAAGTAGRPGMVHEIGGWGDSDTPGHERLAALHGYEPFRFGFEMRRPIDAPIPEAPLPSGLEIRPVRPEHHRAIWDADCEAFQDHFEPAVRTESDYERWFTSPTLDTSLWKVAWDGGDVAGSVMTSINDEENARIGLKIAWLDHVSVRRPWRQRGLAAALIAATLELLRERGAEVAALGVDGLNPTGALHLYEKLGFARHKTGIRYRKTLDV
jgi:mycothiol synthase